MVAAVCLLLAPCELPLAGCSVPVFRYALERWPASPYELIVFHQGPLSALDQDQVLRLASNRPPANLMLRFVDQAAPATRDPNGLLPPSHSLPAWSLVYPRSEGSLRIAATGLVQGEALASLFDSPARRRIAQRLLQGDSAVWVLLESGDASRDNTAFNLLKARLDHLQKTLQLPKLAAEDVTNNVISLAESELKIAFSCERLSRADPKEAVLVQMLLGSEPDLAEEKAPMAFPVFGRGRLLYALVGGGINHETIDEACRLLVGPCSCVVKDENPGIDLLMVANWESVVRARPSAPGDSLPLAGLTTFSANTNQPPATEPPKTPPKLGQTDARKRRSAGEKDQPAPSSRVLPRIALLGLAVVVFVSAGTLWLKRRRA